MRKNSNKPVKAGILASLGIGLTILVVVLGIVAIGFHIVESLDDNSKKLKLYQVKKDIEIQKSPASDLLNFKAAKPIHRKYQQLYYEGDVLFAQQQPRKAIKLYEQSIQALMDELDGQKHQVSDEHHIAACHNKIAQCYLSLRQYQPAIEQATLAINESPTSHDHYLLRAKLYSLTGRKSLSEADMKKGKLEENQWKQDMKEGPSMAADVMRDMLDKDEPTAKP